MNSLTLAKIAKDGFLDRALKAAGYIDINNPEQKHFKIFLKHFGLSQGGATFEPELFKKNVLAFLQENCFDAESHIQGHTLTNKHFHLHRYTDQNPDTCMPRSILAKFVPYEEKEFLKYVEYKSFLNPQIYDRLVNHPDKITMEDLYNKECVEGKYRIDTETNKMASYDGIKEKDRLELLKKYYERIDKYFSDPTKTATLVTAQSPLLRLQLITKGNLLINFLEVSEWTFDYYDQKMRSNDSIIDTMKDFCEDPENKLNCETYHRVTEELEVLQELMNGRRVPNQKEKQEKIEQANKELNIDQTKFIYVPADKISIIGDNTQKNSLPPQKGAGFP